MQYLVASPSPSFLLHANTLQFHRVRSSRPSLLIKPHCANKQQQSQASVKTSLPWIPLSLSLFGTGFLFGPLLDGLHSRVDLVVYKSGSIDIGPLHTDIWVCVLSTSFSSTFFNAFNLHTTIHNNTISIPAFHRFLSCWGCFTAPLVCFNSI